jgi:hypothetical protein
MNEFQALFEPLALKNKFRLGGAEAMSHIR